MSGLPADVRAALRAAKASAPVSSRDKVAPVDMSALPFAPPAPRVREARRGRLRPFNPDTRAAKRLATHGKHADWVACLWCCACFPEHYKGPELKPFLLDRDPEDPEQRIGDPHHIETRGAGGKKDKCVPLCPMHHKELDSPGWGAATFQATYRLNFGRIADLLWRHSPYREEGGEPR